jgi:uncharacterized protein (TIGR02265 family)
VGRVLAAAAPLLGPERVLARLPTHARTGMEGAQLDMQMLSPCLWRAQVTVSHPVPEFFCGAVEGVLLLAGATSPCCTVTASQATTYEVLIRWQAG